MSFTAPEIIKNDNEVSLDSQGKRDLIEFLLKLELNDAFIIDYDMAPKYMELAEALGITLKSKDCYEGFRSWKVKLKRVA